MLNIHTEDGVHYEGAASGSEAASSCSPGPGKRVQLGAQGQREGQRLRQGQRLRPVCFREGVLPGKARSPTGRLRVCRGSLTGKWCSIEIHRDFPNPSMCKDDRMGPGTSFLRSKSSDTVSPAGFDFCTETMRRRMLWLLRKDRDPLWPGLKDGFPARPLMCISPLSEVRGGGTSLMSTFGRPVMSTTSRGV